MAASTIVRSTWTDDDGSGLTGTIIQNSELQKIYDAIDLFLSGTGSYATLTLGGNLRVEGTKGLGLLGQATGDLVVSAAGDATIAYDSTLGAVVRSINGGAYANIIAGSSVYAATLANADNSASNIDVIAFTPDSPVSNGDMIHIWCYALTKNDTGSAKTYTMQVGIAAASHTLLEQPAPEDSSSEFGNFFHLVYMRVGTALICWDAGAAIMENLTTHGVIGDTFNPQISTFAGPNFAAGVAWVIRVQLPSADPTLYFKPQRATIMHIRN